MAQWGKEDKAEDSVLWGPALVKTEVTEANRDALFQNTTPDAFITGVTVGQYGFDTDEMADANNAPTPAHAGWVLTTEGSGGRAGRVQHEVLVAMGSIEQP